MFLLHGRKNIKFRSILKSTVMLIVHSCGNTNANKSPEKQQKKRPPFRKFALPIESLFVYLHPKIAN